MERHTELGPSVRFGPFELDVRTAELRYNGHNIHLHEQAFQILLALLERPGELVSREELIQRLWPNGTFVDYERGLNKTVNKLRDVLRDSADAPRFIETIPRRGYRFIAPLEGGSPLVKVEDTALAGIAIPSTEDLATAHAARAARRRKFAVLGVLTTIAAVGIVVGDLYARRIWRAPTPTFSPLTFRHGTIFSARFAPDGQTVIYSAKWGTEDTQVFLTRLDSPESRPLGIAKSELLAVSSSGELAIVIGCDFMFAPVSCGGTLATVPLGGGAPRQIAENVYYADWTPDGKSLAIIRSVGDRATLELPPGKVLYETEGWISSPRVSPNGDLVAFVDHPFPGDDNGSVVVVDVHGRKSPLSVGWLSVEGLAWSAQRNEIWFIAMAKSAPGYGLHAVSLSGRERLLTGLPGKVRLFDIFRNGDLLLDQDNLRGTEIAFGSISEPKERDLSWLDGSIGPQLSADGKTLLFFEGGMGGGPSYTTYTRKTDGSPAVKLGNGVAEALSPDGKWVLSNINLPVPGKLVLYPTGAGEPQLLDLGKIEYEGGAEWFHDGKRILFQGHEPGHYSGNFHVRNLYVKELAGKTMPIGPEIGGKGPMSADGNFVLVRLNRQVWRYPLDGGPPLPTHGIKKSDLLICWSADSRFVYLSEGDLPAKVYKVAPTSGRRQLLLELMPPDPSGVNRISSVSLTPNAKSYAYGYLRVLSDLYLVKGLR